MRVKHLFIIISLLLFAATTYSQDLKIKEIIKNDDYKFPVITSSKLNSRIAKKINSYIQIKSYGSLVKKSKIPRVNDFNLVEMLIQDNLEYSLNRNDSSIFSISLYAEYCSAYCTFNSLHYNFNSKTGNSFLLRDLFTKTGYVKIKEDLIKERVKRIKKEIAVNKKAKRDTEEKREYFKEQKELYLSCLKDIYSKNEHYYKDFYIKGKTIHFFRESCSPHAFRAMDEIGSFRNKRTRKELKPWLNDFGKFLLFNKGGAKRDGITNKIFFGKVAKKFPITLLLGKTFESDKISGGYLYDKQGKVIPLAGKRTAPNRLLLNEYNEEREVTAKIDLTFTGTNAKGSWTNQKNGKVLTIELTQ